MVGVFIPIYFLTLGYKVADIFFFYIVNNLAILVFFFAAAYFAHFFGFAKTLAVRLAFLFANLFFLFNLKSYPDAFYLVSVLSAAEIAFYWFPLHVIFAKAISKNKIGEQVGNLVAIPGLIYALLPFIGASISALLGFKALFVISGVLYSASILPLLFVRRVPVEVTISIKKIFSYSRRFKQFFLYEAIMSFVGEIEGYILPIFLFLTFTNILSVGAMASLFGLGSAIFAVLIGDYADKFDKKKLFRAGSAAMLIIWLARFFALDQQSFLVLSTFAGFLGVMVSVPFTAMLYENAKKSDEEDFIIFQEIPSALGRVLFYGLALLLISNINVSFLLAALSYLALIFI